MMTRDEVFEAIVAYGYHPYTPEAKVILDEYDRLTAELAALRAERTQLRETLTLGYGYVTMALSEPPDIDTAHLVKLATLFEGVLAATEPPAEGSAQ